MGKKILYVVNVADAQSIPLELGLAIKKAWPGELVIAGFYGAGDHPVDHDATAVVSIGAQKATDWTAAGRLRRLIHDERPDIVHMHHAVSAFYCFLFSRLSFNWPRLMKTEHNDHRHLPWHQTAINWVLYPFLSQIICNSKTTLASFKPLTRFLCGKRGSAIYNGVDLDRVRAAKPATLPGPRPKSAPVVIGHTGRMVAQKNQLRMIEALAQARATSGRDIRIEMLGTGKLLPQLKAKAASLGLEDALIITGAVPRDVVYAKLYEWDGFIMPSVFEGFCNALVEAMAAGLPVACSDIDTLREVAGPQGIKFPYDDVPAMAQALLTLADQPRNDGSYADRYSIERAVTDHIAAYDRVLR